MNIQELKKARQISSEIKKLFPNTQRRVFSKPKKQNNLDFLYKYGAQRPKLKKEVSRIPSPLKFDYEALKVRDGKDGRDGKDVNIEEVVARILAALKVPEIDVEEAVKQVIEKIQKEKLIDVSHIRNFQSFVYKGTKYQVEELMHGGASSSASGSTLTSETPTGAIDDSNVTFTVVHQPLYIIVNGAQYTVGTGLYASYLAGTITLTSAVGTGGFITSFYNS